MSYNPLKANKGRGLEDTVKLQNEIYRNHGICNIQKISTPWKVIRRGKDIVSAFPEEKSTLDFRGTVKGGISVSFDTKESEDERGLPLKYIAQHQIDYIRQALPLGEVSFILCEIKPRHAYYVIPGRTVLDAWDAWKANKGKRDTTLSRWRICCLCRRIRGMRWIICWWCRRIRGRCRNDTEGS